MLTPPTNPALAPAPLPVLPRDPETLAWDWLSGVALPLWLSNGVDRIHGGYAEQMGLDGAPRHPGFKRTRVIGRQIYVFSHAAMLGEPGAAEAARHGFEFLIANAWLGPEGGWARRLSEDGRVRDATPDLYDLSFVLFALGWHHRASGEPEARTWAIRTLDYICAHMRHPDGEGFLAEAPATGPRQQNPHMHLLEAALVNLETTQDARFADLADELVGLFERRFIDPRSGALGEYFDDAWRRAPGAAGAMVEPGHQFEWAWILAIYHRLTGRDVSAHVRRLTAFAERHGVDAAGLAVNGVGHDGAVLDAGSRIWPNTERIQAAVALFEMTGADPRRAFDEAVRALFRHFLDHGAPGTWIDHIDAQGAPVGDHAPASALYHIMIAFSEMRRVMPAVHAAFGAGRVPHADEATHSAASG